MCGKPEIITDASSWLKMSYDMLDGNAIFTSPYLSSDICQQIADVFRQSEFSCQVVTSLDPSAVANGYLSVRGLETLLNAGIDVRHLSRLHAKCFIIGSRAMLGSANLTGAGLGSSQNKNFEMGISLNDTQREEVLAVVSRWPSSPVSQGDLKKLLEQSTSLSVSVSSHQVPTPLTGLQMVEKLLLDAREEGRRFWVKLEHGTPSLDAWRDEHFFASPAKGKPSFKPGDLVFVSAKDTKDCYAVVEILTEAERTPEYYTHATGITHEGVERWPWANRTIPRFVPDRLLELKQSELGVKAQGLQNGHVELSFDQFTTGVRSLARLLTE